MIKKNGILVEERQFVLQSVNQLADKWIKRKEEDIIERTRRYKSALKLSKQMEALGSTLKAIDYLSLAAEEGILLGELYLRKASMYESIGYEAQRIECLEMSLKADQKNHELAKELGFYFMKSPDYVKAIDCLKLALVGEGHEDASIYQHISECYQSLGLRREASAYDQRASKAALVNNFGGWNG